MGMKWDNIYKASHTEYDKMGPQVIADFLH